MRIDRCDLADIHAPRRLAEALHRLLGPVDGAVPILDIARALDIGEIRQQAFDGFEGMLLTDTRRSTGMILANIRYGHRRARFTIAHELGHFLLERHVLSDTAGFRCLPADLRETHEGKQHVRQESEANRFAIEVLAPTSQVRPFLNDPPDLRAAQKMRDRLDISLEAGIRRLIELHDEPLAAVWSKDGRIRYSVPSRRFPYVTRTKGHSLPQTTPAFRAIAAGKRGFTEMVETHGLAWTSWPDLTLREQTRVGDKGHAVTLLWADLPEAREERDDDGGLPELGTPRFR